MSSFGRASSRRSTSSNSTLFSQGYLRGCSLVHEALPVRSEQILHWNNGVPELQSENERYVRISDRRTDRDRKIVKSSFKGTNSKKISEGLSRMLMTTVTGVDNRNRRSHRSYERSTFFWMTHSTDISITGNNTNCIGNTFAFGSGTGTG